MRSWKALFTVTALVTLLASPSVYAQDSSKPKFVAPDLERAKLQLEREKFEKNNELEQARLNLEAQKAWISGGATLVPLLVGALSILYGVWNQNEQAKLQRAQQEKEAQLQFELKAAELVLNAQGPDGTKNKAMALKTLFKNRLPKDFVSSFDPNDFAFDESSGSRSKSYQSFGDVHIKEKDFVIGRQPPESSSDHQSPA